MSNKNKTTPRRLIQEVIRSLERRFGAQAENECLQLAQANVLLQRVDLALHANPESEWPTVFAGVGVVELEPTDNTRRSFATARPCSALLKRSKGSAQRA